MKTMDKPPVTGGQAMAVVLAVGAGIVDFYPTLVTKKRRAWSLIIYLKRECAKTFFYDIIIYMARKA